MTTYFMMYFFVSYLALKNLYLSKSLWFLFFLIFSIIIGFRFEVGGDWIHYFDAYERMQFETISSILFHKDPGYYLINFIMYNLDLGIYGVNFISALLFMFGLIKFAKQEYNPWMVIATAVPYTVIVVSMGYTRQAIALSFVMWALVYLRKNKIIYFFLLITIAATFHKTAVIMIGLGIFASGGNRFLQIIAVLSIGYGLYDMFLSAHTDTLIKNYVDSQMQSSGAKIRTFMNLIPAILLIIYRKRWKELFDDFTFWFIIALLSIVSFAIVGFASTAVDRMALYLLPIQMIVFARLGILMSHQFNPSYVNLSIIGYYGLVLFVWLNFAKHAYVWLPYQNILIHDLW